MIRFGAKIRNAQKIDEGFVLSKGMLPSRIAETLLLRRLLATCGTSLGRRIGEHRMRGFMVAAAVAAMFGLTTAAEAKGCIKGAIVGGVAGHYTGHPILGAMAGCVVGRHLANRPARVVAPAPNAAPAN